MEKLIREVAQKPEEFIKMPYGTLAYLMFIAAMGNAAFSIIEPIALVGLVFCMMGFRMIAAGREHLLQEEIETWLKNPEINRDKLAVRIADHKTTTRHMKDMALLCALLAAIIIISGIEYRTMWLPN